MTLLFSEREKRAEEKLARQRGRVNFMSVGTQIEVLNLVKRERREEDILADKKMAEIAARDAANAAKRELKILAVQVPIVETCAAAETDIAIDKANRRRQKSRPPNPHHPVYQEAKEERRLERAFNPQPRKPAGEDWREKLTADPHWQDALKWFGMTPEQRAAAEGKIEIAVNTEIGPVAQALAAQAEWDELAASGELEQMDFSGFTWPMNEK